MSDETVDITTDLKKATELLQAVNDHIKKEDAKESQIDEIVRSLKQRSEQLLLRAKELDETREMQHDNVSGYGRVFDAALEIVAVLKKHDMSLVGKDKALGWARDMAGC